MRSTIKILAEGRMGKLRTATLLNIIQFILKGAPYGFLILVLWALFAPSVDTQKVIWLMVSMFAILILHLIIAIIAQTKISVNACDLCADVRLRLAEHLKKLSVGFFKRRDPGDITAVLLQDMENVERIFSHLYVDIIGAIVLPATIALFLFFVDWRLALATIVAVPVAIPMLMIARKVIGYLGEKQIDARTNAVSRMLEYLQGIKVIKAFNLRGEKFERLDNTLKKLRKDSIMLEATAAPLVLTYMLILESGFIVVLLLGAHFLFVESLTVPVFLMFLIIGNRFYDALQHVGGFLSEMRYMKISADRVMDVLEEKPLSEPVFEEKLDKFDIAFKNVTFGYHDTHVLRDVSFKASERTITALVGPSGSGKTTITNLIARFWDVDSGEVLLGGKNIKGFKNEHLLSNISMVFQDVYLFNDTIYNNIKVGKVDATREELIATARAAQCHEFIEKFPDGYDTIVGEGGSTLSSGEKQRISIARAILKDAPIVLLDEATASLDPENEMLIQQAINELVQSKTLIVIAHQLSTIKHAHQILVVDHGKIVERGKHEELLAKSGLYNCLWQEQRKTKGWKFGSGNQQSAVASAELV